MCLYISEFLWALCLHSSIHLCAVSCVSMWVCLPLARLIQWFGAYHRNKLWCEWLLLVQTRYIAAWDKENYPAILLSSNQAFELHGMGSLYKDNMGKVAMYINTVKGVGENGRGGGQVTSPIKLAVGQWYTIFVETVLRGLMGGPAAAAAASAAAASSSRNATMVPLASDPLVVLEQHVVLQFELSSAVLASMQALIVGVASVSVICAKLAAVAAAHPIAMIFVMLCVWCLQAQ